MKVLIFNFSRRKRTSFWQTIFKIINLFFIFYFLFCFTLASPVFASQEECKKQCDLSKCTPGGLMSKVPKECACCGCCELNDILRIIVGVAQLILRWVGVLALIFFVIGGIIWLTSGGNPESVKRGKQILVGTVIGLFIVFLAWQIVNIVICGLSQGRVEESCKIFGQKWYVFPGEKEKPKVPVISDAPCFSEWTECPSFVTMGPNPIWQSNCKGENVKTLQEKLANYNCYLSPGIDGCFGPETRNAVKSFCQKNSGCGTGGSDGYVDQTTYNLITTGINLTPCQ